MTRETKIGLLVGLGFIVVFAVLLSHTGVPPASERLTEVTARPGPASSDRDGMRHLRSGPQADRAGAPVQDELTAPTPSSPVGREPVVSPGPEVDEDSGLPVAEMFTPLPENWYRAETPEESTRTGEAPAHPRPGRPDRALESTPQPYDQADATPEAMVQIRHYRIAPQAVEVVPRPTATERPDLPRRSAAPEVAMGEPGEDMIWEEESGSSPTLRSAPPVRSAAVKEHTVARGETLGQIAREAYGTAAPRVLDFLVKANEGRIKDKDFVVEGQTIVLPELPADQFERVTDLSVERINRGATAVTMEELVGGAPPRRAPAPVRAPESDAGEASAKANPGYRSYVVQPKDTFSSIAKRELGSEALWKEIQKLNQDIDPTRMQPGTVIQLPKRPELDSTVASRRAAT